LVAAARWIANNNPDAARALRDAVARAAERIGEHPQIGVVRAHLLRPVFRFLVLSGFPYIIIHNAERSPPEIVAIVHTARNLPPLLRDLIKG
jgi:toxin ParE1/3/4